MYIKSIQISLVVKNNNLKKFLIFWNYSIILIF